MSKSAEEIQAELQKMLAESEAQTPEVQADNVDDTETNLTAVPVLAEPVYKQTPGEARESTLVKRPDALGADTPLSQDSRGGSQNTFERETRMQGDVSCPSPSTKEREEPRSPAQKPLSNSVTQTAKNVTRSGRSVTQLPNSEIAEKGVLSCMLKAPETIIPIVQQAVAPDYFYLPTNRQLFTEICTFYADEGTLYLPTLTQHLMDVGRIKSIGGPSYLTELAIDFNAIPEAISYYLDILKDKHARRTIIQVGQGAAKRALELGEHEETGDIFEDLFTSLELARSGLTGGSMRLPALCDISMFLNGNRPPLPAQLVEGILHQGSKLVVGGTSKGRKTMALIDLAVSVATGSRWWGFPCVKGPVCYINFEIQDPFFAHRTHVVCEAKKVDLPRNQLMVWNLRGHGEGLENLTNDLMAVLRHKHFVLIIIDPIYKGLGSRDENKAGDVASMMNELEKIAVKTRAAVAFGAHYSKGNQALKESIDRIGGSGVFARDPDSILTMTAHEEEECFTVDTTLRNFPPMDPFVLKFEWPLFGRNHEADPEAIKQPKTAGANEKYPASLLLDQLSIIHGLQPREAVKILMDTEGCSRRTVFNLKDKLQATGKLIVRDGMWWRASKGEQNE